MTLDAEVVRVPVSAPPHAAAEYADLQRALLDADRVPCVGRLEWVSRDKRDQARARAACLPCPVRGPCGAYATKAKPIETTWNAVTYLPRRP